MLKKIFILVGLILPLCLLADAFTVIEMETEYLVVKFTLPEYEIIQTEKNNITYDKIVCDAAPCTEDEGQFVVPFFSEVIGLPVDGDLSIQIIDKHQIKTKISSLLPVSATSLEKTKRAIKSNALYPAQIIKKGDPAYLRDRYFCGVNVFPFQYAESTHQLLITTELTLRIDLQGDCSIRSGVRQSSEFFDEIGDDFFLNNTYSKNWHKAKEKANYTYQSSRSGDLVDEIQIFVNEEGIYKITYDYLMDALADPDYPLDFELAFDWDDIDPRYLELRDEFGAVPINFVGEDDGSFDPGDFFEFYGDRHYGDDSYNDDFTAENVYFLSLEEHFGSRMTVENGGLNSVNTATIPSSFQQTVRIEEQNTYDLLVAQYEHTSEDYFREDIWFWDKISAPSLHAYPFEIQYPIESNSRKFTAHVCLFGQTYNKDNYNAINHKAQANLNANLLDIVEWYGQTEVILNNEDNPIANLNLNHDENILYINLPGLENITNESVLLDYLELTYWRAYKTDTDYIKFTKPQDENPGVFQFELENFSNPHISIYKVGASIFENASITADEETEAAPYTATFQDSINFDSTEYIAVTDEMKKTPLKIIPNHPSSLKDPLNSAQFVIITIQDYIMNEALLNYQQIWEDRGVSLKIVALQDIFDEFNGGIRSAEAIRDFIRYAYNNWSEPELSHVMLLGDGLTDERDDSPVRNYNLIPFKNVWVSARGAIASDNWLACIIGDDPVADISISRVPVYQESQIEPVLAKSIHYMEEPNHEDYWHSNITLAAGGNVGEGAFFANQSENIRHTWIPDKFHVKRIYCNVTGLPAGYFGNTTGLISNINDGSVYIQFMGHGGGYVWADYNLLNLYDIASFNNENYPLVASLSCYGSAFNFSGSSCLGEELILRPNKGAIGHIGFTGYGYENADEDFAMKINQALFSINISNMGDIVDFTKARFYASWGNGVAGNALTSGCALIGDPFIDLYIPTEEVDVVLNSHNVSAGDTLRFSAEVGNDITAGKFVIYNEDDVQLALNIYYPFNITPVNGTISGSFVIPNTYTDITTQKVKLFAYGPGKELLGMDEYSIGEAVLSNLTITPDNPTQYDEIMIGADFFDEDGIDHIIFYNEKEGYTRSMVQVENNYYQLSQSIPEHAPGMDIDFHFKIFDTIGDSTSTETYEILVSGPDLWLQHIQLTELDNQPALKLYMSNIGDTDAPGFNLYIYDALDQYTLVGSKSVEPLALSEGRWEYVNVSILNEFISFYAIINPFGQLFTEKSPYNNMLRSDTYQMNMFTINGSNPSATSLDGNLECTFSSEITALEPIISINQDSYLEPLNQPDIMTVYLADSTYSPVYEIKTLEESILADTLGNLINNGTFTLRMNYSSTDSLTQYLETYNRFKIYRWEDKYQKWVTVLGTTNTAEDYVEAELDRIGIYTLLFNLDTTIPDVEVNVEDQELTQSYATASNPDLIQVGYIAKDGIISYNLFDENGIDIFERPITLTLDDGTNITEIDPNLFSVSATYGKLTEVPVKYQLANYQKGEYSLTLTCHDVNGNEKNLVFEFSVNNKFAILNFANYPNPVKSNTLYPENEGRTRFTYVLTDDADKVYIKVYSVSGRLVRTFNDLPNAVGYHEFPRSDIGWDCRDNKGHLLANGVYFYRITATKGSKKIEKTEKMAILR